MLSRASLTQGNIAQGFYLCNVVSKVLTEAALQRCSKEKVLWKYSANLPENTHAEVRFQ